MKDYDAYVNLGMESSGYLEHHGILGQKWGIRRFQNEDGTLTNAGKERYQDGSKKTIKERWDSLNPKTKTAIKVGVAVAGTALAAYGAYKFYNDTAYGVFDAARDINYDAKSGLIKKARGDASTALDDFMSTNPKGATRQSEFLNNCSHCSATYDLRRRGFNVTAKPGLGESQRTIDSYYKNAEKKIVSPTALLENDSFSWDNRVTIDKARLYAQRMAREDPQSFSLLQRQHANKIVEQCESFGANARGNITFGTSTGGGHSIAFETDSSGRVKFIDSQLPSVIGPEKAEGGRGSWYYNHGILKNNPFASVHITRTDNATPNYEFLREHNIIANPKTYNPRLTDTVGLGISAFGASVAVGATKNIINERPKKAINSGNNADLKIIRKYRAEHPNSKMSDSEILESLKGV